MTAIIDDWFDALRDTFKPISATGKWNLGVTVGKYYKRMIIPLILAIIVDLLLVPWGVGKLSHTAGTAIGAGTLTILEILSITLGLIVLAPIGLLIEGAVYHIFGQMVGAIKKGTYSDTVSATMHSYMPGVTLYFAMIALVWLLLGFAGIRGLLVAVVVIILVSIVWRVWVFVESFAAIHKTTKMKAFLTWLAPSIICFVTAALVAAYIVELSSIMHVAI